MGEGVHRIDAPLVAGVVVRGVADAVDGRVAQVDVGRAMSILARRMWVPSANSPACMRLNRSMFSATLRLRNGESLPGWVSVPRLARISSADWLST
jgi:hypothetical protein